MNILVKFRDFIYAREEKEIYTYIGIIIGIVVLIMGILLYTYTSRASNWQTKIKRINKQREETRTILQKYEMVKQQKTEVDTILAKDSSFKIKEYFTGVITELGLTPYNTKPAEVSEPQDLTSDYAEIKLDAGFTELTTKQLTDLLYKIEQNERVYTKELVITKALKTPTIDVTLVIATLQPKAETA